MTRDYSPAMLRFFLQARAFLRADLAGVPIRKARGQIAGETARVARVKRRQVEAAMSGRSVPAGEHARIWRALGHDVAEDGGPSNG
ncbi:hypothetical protein [Zhengella mangrovi]|nr:hypothetical protein [Zhengella mangrovi]